MDQQPKIPTLKDAQKPQVKVKGMGAGLTLFDRLKQFKKKDLAFILAGLGTLFMAPLAEHFMMAPESGAELKGGFGGGQGSSGGAGIFGSGSSPYENGNNSIAQGGAVGGAGDIITPLNVRDPSALVMGPGAAQQPPAGSAAPAVAPPTSAPAKETDYKDALAGAASRAASAAVKKSPLPIPKIAVGGSGLRGLGAASGGSSAGASLGPIGPAAGSTGSGGGGSLNLVKTAPNFRGVAGARGPGNPTGLDGTKKAGANAGDAFSRTGNALNGLNAAASEQIPTGAGGGFGGGGQGGAGANDKAGGGGQAPGSKSVGESLAFIEAKERMMENLKLEFEKKKLKDPELLMYGIRNDVLKASAGEVGKWITKGLMDGADKLLAPSGANAFTLTCGSSTGLPIKENWDATAKTGVTQSNGDWVMVDKTGTRTTCKIVQGDAKSKVDPKAEGRSPTGTDGLNGEQPISDRNSTGDANNLKTACSDLGTIMQPPAPKPETKSDGTTTVVTAAASTGKIQDEAQAAARFKEAAEYSTVKKALVGETTDGCLFPKQKPEIAALSSMNPSVASLQKDALDAAAAATKALKEGAAKDAVEADKYATLYKTAYDKAAKAREALDKVTTAAGADLSGIELGSKLEWSPSTLVTGDNGRKLGAIQNVLNTSRTEVAGKLKGMIEAQGTIDGVLAKDAPAPTGKDVAVIAGLAEVVGSDGKSNVAKVEGSPINLTQKTSADFKEYAAGLKGKPVDEPKDAKAESYTADKDGIVKNAKTGSGTYDNLKIAAGKAIDNSVEVETKSKADPPTKTAAEVKTAREEATAAVSKLKGAMLGVQKAQGDWVDTIDKRVTEARSKVPGAAAGK